MSREVLNLAQMSSPEVDALDRENTLFVMALSPLEVHGPHLPLGTDVILAKGYAQHALDRTRERWPELRIVLFPPYYLGSDTIPRSVDIDSRAVYFLLKGSADFLADRGFNYLLVIDNHGGPRHQIAAAKAVRDLWRRRGFHIIMPYLSFYRRMIEDDPELLEHLGVGPGSCGDMDDDHAGLAETSLMLSTDPSQVRPEWKELNRTTIDRRRWPNLLLGTLARVLLALGFRDMAQDVGHAGLLLSWVTSRESCTYIGEPCAASPQAGERMMDAHSRETLDLMEAAIEGRPPYHTPLGWSLRFIEPSR